MPFIQSSDQARSRLNFTELSTVSLLVGVGITCAVLWSIIATTVV